MIDEDMERLREEIENGPEYDNYDDIEDEFEVDELWAKIYEEALQGK